MKVANFDALASINDPVVQRFVNKIDATQGCWIWIGSLDTAGYGCFRFNDKTTLAHRVMWRLVYDQWPTGVLDHKCINPPCVNPAHLDDVSIAENNLRAIAAGLRKKTHCINGHELTPENTGRYKKQGANYCKTCRKEDNLRYKRAKAARAALSDPSATVTT